MSKAWDEKIAECAALASKLAAVTKERDEWKKHDALMTEELHKYSTMLRQSNERIAALESFDRHLTDNPL